jgi:hypothetical protein
MTRSPPAALAAGSARRVRAARLRHALLASQPRVLCLKGSVLLAQGGMRLGQLGVLVLKQGSANARGLGVLFASFESAVGFAETVLQHAFESRLGIALVGASAFFALEAALGAAHGHVDQQASQGQAGGDERAATNAMPQSFRVHA